MNNIKKASSLISPEPLLNARRSSLPLSLDTAHGNSPLLDIVKKFNYSPRISNALPTESSFQLPRIVFKSPSTPSASPQACKINASLQRVPKEREAVQNQKRFNDSYLNRRSSCGAIFSPNSPLDNWLQSYLNRRSSDFCKSVSPTQWNSDETNRKLFEEISPNRLPRLHFPSLSPCFEDKPKQNCFPFPQNSITFDGDSSECLCKVNKEETTGSSFTSKTCNFFSPLCQKDTKRLNNRAKIRRNSYGSAIFYPYADSFAELSEGNSELIERGQSFSLDSVLGKGGFGVVKVECWQGEKVAIKILKESKSFASIKNEEYSLSFGFHLNLVETKAVVISKEFSEAEVRSLKKETEWFCSHVLSTASLQSMIGINELLFSSNSSTNKWSLVISELCTSETLLTLINSKKISDKDKLRFLYQIASALQHMHKKGYVHLDVKPSNCFISQSGIMKLGDFGCTCKLNDVPAHSLGTVAYQAPEALKGNPVTDRCDIYSLGITIWQLLTRESPYTGEHPHVIIYKVTRMNCRPSTKKEMKTSFIADALFSLAEKCWMETPSQRPRIETLIDIFCSLYFASFSLGLRGKSFKKSSF